MALVTVHRSPSPTGDHHEDNSLSLSRTDGDGSNSTKPIPKTPSFSESYLTVKGAALILPQTEHTRTISSESSRGGIQVHLQLMLYLLRVQDKLKLAVKLESRVGGANHPQDEKQPPPNVPLLPMHSRYMALVSSQIESSGTKHDEANVILGIDILDSKATVGLVLPVWGDCNLCLDGDGGFNVCTNGRFHNFKPVSVQAMWAALQCLIKARDVASCNRHIPNVSLDSWVSIYSALISSDTSFLCEWHSTAESSPKDEGLTLGNSDSKPVDTQLEKVIRSKLKQVMMVVDLEEVTSKYLREKLEVDMGISLTAWKRFIDDEMIVVMRQMDAPSEVFPYLYLGSEWNASNLEELQSNKVGYILNVTREIANFYPETFEYYNIRIFDEEDSDLLKHWENTHKFISKARDVNSKVLVHCKMGVSRSASTVVAFVMKEMKMGYLEAMKFVRSKRSCIQPNGGFRRQLEVYEGILDASKQRHSHLWKSSSSADFQENLVVPESLKPASLNANATRTNSPSPASSPSSSTINCDYQSRCPSKINEIDTSQQDVRLLENEDPFIDHHKDASNSQCSQLSVRKHLRYASTSSDDAVGLGANGCFYARQSGALLHSLSFAGDNRDHSSLPKTKSLLSLLKPDLSYRDVTSSRKTELLSYSRSRSVSPKSHGAGCSVYKKSSRVLTPKKENRADANSKISSKDPYFGSTTHSSRKADSICSRLRPDNFWIRDAMLAGGSPQFNENRTQNMQNDNVERTPSEKKKHLSSKDLVSGKVKKTKSEIEKRERILSHPSTSRKDCKKVLNEDLDIMPQIQRSSSCRMERSKMKDFEEDRRKTHPPLDSNRDDCVSPFHDCSNAPKGINFNEHSIAYLKIPSFWNCRHTSIPDCSELMTTRTLHRLGSDIFELESGIVSKAKKEFESMSFLGTKNLLQASVADFNRYYDYPSNLCKSIQACPKTTPSLKYVSNQSCKLLANTISKTVHPPSTCKRSLHFGDNPTSPVRSLEASDNPKLPKRVSSERTLSHLMDKQNSFCGSNNQEIMFADSAILCKKRPGKSRHLREFHKTYSLPADKLAEMFPDGILTADGSVPSPSRSDLWEVCRNCSDSDFRSVKGSRSKGSCSTQEDQDAVVTSLNSIASSESFQAIYQESQKTFQSPVIVVPSVEQHGCSTPTRDKMKPKRPQDLAVAGCEDFSTSGEIFAQDQSKLPSSEHVSFEGEKILASTKLSTRDLNNFNICSVPTSFQEYIHHISVAPTSGSAKLQDVTPAFCGSFEEEEVAPAADNCPFVASDADCPSSCSKPPTPTYHADQSLLCN